jgi:hypothetical protein
MAIVLDTDIAAAKKPLKKLPNVITSFNWQGWERYGKRFIETWKEFGPPTIKLTVYYEGPEFENFEFPTGVSWRPIEEVEFLQDYLDSLRFPIMHGIVGDRYDINFDARQSRKAFMEVHAARTMGGKIFWFDADAVLYKHMPESFLDQCLPDDKFCCYLGRDGWYFTESGFIGFNADHPIANEFFRAYLHIFITGVIFTQQWWHDCIGFDCTRALAAQKGMDGEFVNLAKYVPKGTMHPHANSAPGKYIKHLKGDRKESGDLKEGDVIAKVA